MQGAVNIDPSCADVHRMWSSTRDIFVAESWRGGASHRVARCVGKACLCTNTLEIAIPAPQNRRQQSCQHLVHRCDQRKTKGDQTTRDSGQSSRVPNHHAGFECMVANVSVGVNRTVVFVERSIRLLSVVGCTMRFTPRIEGLHYHEIVCLCSRVLTQSQYVGINTNP